MKKSISVVLAAAVLMAGLFSGCSKKSETKDSKLTKETMKVGFVYIGVKNDGGYSEAHERGRQAVEAMGIKTAVVESISDSDTAACEKAIHDLIDQGCNVIYTNSFGYMDATMNMAKEFPNVYFGHCSSDATLPNMCSYFGKMYQARYLAGIVAGKNTKNGKIGYVAAFPIPECIRMLNAFTLGVKSVNKDATVEVVWTNTWYDPAIEKQGALELLNRGCDVIEQHQDTTAPQVAAQEKGALCLGYNVPTPNAAPKAYLTAPIFDWPVFYTSNVQAILDGTWEGKHYWLPASTGIAKLDKLTDLCAPGTQEAVDAVAAKMMKDEFEPFTGPVYDNEGNLKIAEGEKMADKDIWNMMWYVDGVIVK
ncbi:MAG: BMP family ABC transporter substrate-binding protein [Treponema sp.]|nr:BMP family ABC transporter substrate-binding protein [Treponema sp.]